MGDQAIVIPERFAVHAVEVHGDDGRDWVRALPALVNELARQWELTVGRPFALSYNYVVPVVRADGSDAVLKVGVTGDDAMVAESAALGLYAGDGACRLLAVDEARTAMLLERVRPGRMLARLAETDDEAATREGAAVMRRLWRPVPPGARAFDPIAGWFEGYGRHRAAHGGSAPFPSDLFVRAESVATDLLASAPTETVLHGDLHHYNVLSATRAPWLAIDPKGMRGDPGYEVGPFLLNPDLAGAEARPDVLARRLDVLAEELAYDRRRLRDWGLAHAVLSAIWSVEDEGYGWEGAIAAAAALTGL
jgi:streptomycin 6-kinase